MNVHIWIWHIKLGLVLLLYDVNFINANGSCITPHSYLNKRCIILEAPHRNQNRTWFKWEAIMFRKKEHTEFQLKNLIPSVKHSGGSIMVVSGLGLFFCILARTACHHWRNNEFWIIPANSKGKRQDICLRTESQENVGHAARQQPQAHKSFYQRMVKEEQS